MNNERGQLGVLSLDLGSHTGFEIYSKGAFSRDLLDLTKKGKFGENGFYVFDCAVNGLIRVLQKNNIKQEIVVEKPHASRFFHSSRILFGLMGVLHLACHKKKIPLTEVSSKSVKKYWTGNGNADKPAMIARAKQLVSRKIEDDNIADACALMRFYLENRKEEG